MTNMTRDLNDLMEFYHVIRVQDGVATDRMPDGERIPLYAPECYHEGWGDGKHIEDGTGWTLMEGYSGQGYPRGSYNGPIMHASEYIGEGCTMHRDILAQDGYYVTVVCEVLERCCDTCGDEDPTGELPEDAPCPREGCIGTMQDDNEPAGWAVAFRPFELDGE